MECSLHFVVCPWTALQKQGRRSRQRQRSNRQHVSSCTYLIQIASLWDQSIACGAPVYFGTGCTDVRCSLANQLHDNFTAPWYGTWKLSPDGEHTLSSVTL